MKKTKTLLCLLLALVIILCAGCSNTAGAPSNEPSTEPTPSVTPSEEPTPSEDVSDEVTVYQLGDAIEDFTVTTFDGKTVTLSEVLKEKKMVLINIWATWCGPCASEFPYMEEAYQLYKDQIEIVALTCEPADTDDVLADYVAEMGMTFPVAMDTPDFATKFNVTSIPTSIVVDRFGNICFIESGAQTSTDNFARLFDLFIGDDYTESIIQVGIPNQKPNVEPSSEAELTAALNGEGGTLAFTNDADEYAWPMVVGEKDSRSVVVSSNQTVSPSEAVVNTTVTAKAGDAVAVTFKISSETSFDLMEIRVNGETVKSFAGEHDWTTFAWQFEADGEYTVSIVYSKDEYSDGGEDTLWVDSVELLSGDAAAAAVAANPTYLFSDATALTVTTPGAKEIVFDDPNGYLVSEGMTFYIIPGDTAEFLLTLSSDMDPETLYAYCDYDGYTWSLVDCAAGNGYVLSSGIDSVELTGYSYSDVYLYCSLGDDYTMLQVMYFASEENVNDFVASYFTDDDGTALVSWKYADGTLPSTSARPGESIELVTEATYVVKYVDQDGNPVAGVTLQVCDDATCQVFTSDENGICQFALAPYAYELHTLKLPEGYTGDTETVTIAPAEGGELTFTVQKG